MPNNAYVVFYGSECNIDNFVVSGDSSVYYKIEDHNSVSFNKKEICVFFDKIWEGITEVVFAVSITKYPNDVLKDRRTLDLSFADIKNINVNIQEYRGQVYDNFTELDENNYNNNFKYRSLISSYSINPNVESGNIYTKNDALVIGSLIKRDNTWVYKKNEQYFFGSLGFLIEKYT